MRQVRPSDCDRCPDWDAYFDGEEPRPESCGRWLANNGTCRMERRVVRRHLALILLVYVLALGVAFSPILVCWLVHRK